MKTIRYGILGLALLFGHLPVQSTLPVAQALSATSIKEGLCIAFPVVSDKELTDFSGQNVVVQGLCNDLSTVFGLRKSIQEAGLHPQMTVDKPLSFKNLPFVTHLANLVVADLDALGADAPSLEEVIRITAPAGYYYVKQSGTWTSKKKDLIKGMDTWTHYLYNAGGNRVSKDALVTNPSGLQWITSRGGRGYGGASGSTNGYEGETGVLVDGGKVFTEFQNPLIKEAYGVGATYLSARQAFNGIQSWTIREVLANMNTLSHYKPIIAAEGMVFCDIEKGKHTAVIDQATGKILRYLDKGGMLTTKSPQYDANYVYDKGVLYQTAQNTVYAVEVATGNLLWKHTSTQNVFGPRVMEGNNNLYFGTGKFITPWRYTWQLWDTIVCVNRSNGNVIWKSSAPGHQVWENLVISGNIMLLARANMKPDLEIPFDEKTQPHSLRIDPTNGKVIWTSVPFENTRGVIIWRDKLLTGMHGEAWNMHPKFHLSDLATGKYLEHLYGAGKGVTSFSRCQQTSAAANVILCKGAGYIKSDKTMVVSEIARTSCAGFPVPGYGMTYTSTNGCNCAVSMRGLTALHSNRLDTPVELAKRLEKGNGLKSATPAEATSKVSAIIAEDWVANNSNFVNSEFFAPEIYAKDNKGAALSSPFFQQTPAVSSNGNSLVAVVHSHRLEARSGSNVAWSFTAGGRIVWKPVTWDGKVYFGSNDGWVYCLSAGDGSLQWRFLAAASDRKIVAYGQVESAWPVFGVSIENGKIYATAGRHPDLDGGIYAWVLDGKTGAVEKNTVIRFPRGVIKVGGETADKSTDWYGARHQDYPHNTCINEPTSVSNGVLQIAGFSWDTKANTAIMSNRGYSFPKNPLDPYSPVSLAEPVHSSKAPKGKLWFKKGKGVNILVDAKGAFQIKITDARGRLVSSHTGRGNQQFTLSREETGRGLVTVTIQDFRDGSKRRLSTVIP